MMLFRPLCTRPSSVTSYAATKKKRFCRASIWQTPPTQHFLTKTGKKFLNTVFVPAFNLKRSAAVAQRQNIRPTVQRSRVQAQLEKISKKLLMPKMNIRIVISVCREYSLKYNRFIQTRIRATQSIRDRGAKAKGREPIITVIY